MRNIKLELIRLKISILITLLFSFSLFAQTYITDVNILDVEEQNIIPNQTIVVSDSIISNIGAVDKIKIKENSTIINGENKYLMPGLVDSHIHFFQNGGLYARPDVIDLRKYKKYEDEIDLAHKDMETKLKRYLKNGITTVIDVGATYNFLMKRNEFRNKGFSPQIFMSGPLLTTYLPKAYENLGDDAPFVLIKTINEGVNAVKEQLLYKPDLIKIWYIVGSDGLSIEESAQKNLPIVKAVIDEAHKNDLKVAVHATQKITAKLAVENGADFLVHSVKDEVLDDDLVKVMKKNKTILCPTLIVDNGYLNTFSQQHNFDNYELKTADPYQLGSLLDLKHISDTTLVKKYRNYAISKVRQLKQKRRDSISGLNLKMLVDAGVLIATGTDAGNIGTLHASSYLSELKEMNKAGMNNWQIIKASTINGIKILDLENKFGSVEKGKIANLILLEENPIENIENITKINTIINRGDFFKPENIIKDAPEDIVQRQLNAYNLRDIESFMETYSDDIEIYNFPNELKTKGKEAMRKIYSNMFDKLPNLHCELVNRIVSGNIIIDKESVLFKDKTVEGTAIYKVENQKISKVYFIK